MAVDFGGVKMKNPINTASGTFGYGWQFSELMDVSQLGAITTKGCAAEAWPGNPAPRMAEVPGGMMNSVGLQNPGVAAFAEQSGPWLADLTAKGTQVICQVAGAALEKKSDNVKITGEFRALYANHEGKGSISNDYESTLRSRIWITGQINDGWKYTGMLQNTQDLSTDSGDESTDFQRAYLEGRLGGMDVTAGRYNAFFADGNIYDNRADGVEVSYGDKIKIIGAAGKATDDLDKLGVSGTTGGSYAGGAVVADFGKFNASAGYYNFKDILAKNSKLDNAIWFVGAGTEFGDFALNAMYLKGDMSYHDVDLDGLDDDGWTVGLTFKGAEAAKKGSWGLFANYYDLGGQTYIAHTTDANTFDGQGFKGYGVGANYTVAKNMVLTAAYYDTKSKFDTSDKDKIMWTDLTITF